MGSGKRGGLRDGFGQGRRIKGGIARREGEEMGIWVGLEEGGKGLG